jgi:hypothetical protein
MKSDVMAEARKQHEPERTDENSGNLNEAIKSVYRQYGTDLPKFFRDAYEAARKHREMLDKTAETYLP